MRLRILIGALVFAAFSVATPAEQSSTPNLVEELQKVRSELQLKDGQLSGPGGDVLRSAISEAHFVLIGEDHITTEIPQFTAAVCDAMARDGGLSAMVVEASVEAGKFVSSTLTSSDRVASMRRLVRKYPDSIGFLNIREENDLAAHCAQVSRRNNFQLWGLDQEFLGSAGWILQLILATHPGPEATAALSSLKREEEQDAAAARLSGDPSKLLLLSVSEQKLAELQRLLQKEGSTRARALGDELALSSHIYKLNMAGKPEANSERARLLKRNFEQDVSRLRPEDRVLIKFGDWHLYKGFNPLHQRDLGNYIAEFADVRGVTALHICVLGAKGVHALYGGYGRPPKKADFVMDEDPSYRWLKPAVDSQVQNGMTVYDLRQLRFETIAGVDADFQRLIDGYDLLVLMPELTPAEMIQ